MFQVHIRRKGRISRHFLALLCLSALLSTANADGTWSKCLRSTKIGPPRTLNVGVKSNLTLETSSRVTHQLMTHIYRILLEEELGYAQVEVVENDDYSPESIMKRMHCYKMVDRQLQDVVPQSMINLQVPVPPAFTASALEQCVDDLGTMSPPGHFGWFIPLKVNITNQKWNPFRSTDVHWSLFRDINFTQNLQITDKKVLSYVEDNMKATKNGVVSYYCKHVNCTNGWYIPKYCSSRQCALLLAADYENTKVVIEHIESMNMFVKVAWLGPNLVKVSENLTNIYKKVKDKGFVIMSWTPSDVVMDPLNFVIVQMMRCESGIASVEPGCFYDKKLLVKYAWRDLKGENSDNAYSLLKGMNFLDPDHYHSLFDLYKSLRYNTTIPEIACAWVTTSRDIWKYWIREVTNAIYIGGIFPISGSTYTGRGIVKGAKMAVEAVNKNLTILNGYTLELKVADGQCRADKVMKAFIDYLTKNLYNSLVGVLGPACSETVEPLAGLSKYYKTITISYSAEGAVFSDRDKYPYFLRTIGENKNYKYVYLELLKSLGWKRVAALTEDGQKYTEYISHMQETLGSKDIEFVANIKFPRHREKEPMTRYLEDLKSKTARIIIADVFDEIARNVMCEAYKLSMTAKQGYVWFLPTWLNNTWYDTTYFNQHLNESVNCTTANMIEAINGYFAMTHAYFGNDDEIMQENISVGQWREIYQNKSRGVQSSYAGYAYDAVWTYALALDKLLKENPEAMFNLHTTNITNKLTNIIKNSDFNGVSGKIKFRGGTTRFSIINIMQWYDNKSSIIGRFYPNISETTPEILGGRLELNKSAIHWLGSGNKIPDDGTPLPVECTLNSLAKFLNVKCEMAIIILNLFISIILIVSLSSVIIIIKKRYEKKVQNTEEYMKSLGLNHLLATDYTGLDKWEIERESVVLNRKLGEGAFGTVYGGEANLPDGGWSPVAVKTLKVGSTTEEKLDFLSEAEVMKRFDHKNIVKLLGVCTKIEPVYTIMEFMMYGDLKTYLLARRHLVNGTMVDDGEEVSSKKLTSMALDVARGLSYLAELKYVHRDVASRNCLLSQQRVVKLGDFGMTRPTFDNDYYKFNRRGMLPVRWMAPESLALGVFTPSSDVWSFGVLLYEIITFGSFPFQGLSNSQVLDYVKAGNTITIPQGVKAPLECLLKTCWHSDSKLRPTASELVEYLANNSRLISPCLDLPLSSVQMEDTGQLEMQLPDQFRKCSSSLSFKNLPLVNGISSMSIHTPTRRQQSVPGDSGISIPMENCCPKEPLLPPRSDSISGCSKYVTIQHIPADSLCDQDDNEDYFPNPLVNGHAISKV